jgi:hypothetical protein
MNERIEKLAEQAFDKANNGTISDIKIPKEFIEKFAELIVQDCADLAYSYNIFGRGRAWNLIIKEHFGLPVVDADLPPYLRDAGTKND